MVGGALIVAVCLLVLGWTSEIVEFFIKDPGTVGAKCRHFLGLGSQWTSRLNHVRLLWLCSVSTLSILL